MNDIAAPDYTTVQYQSLKGRNVLISGGATGIGADMVTAFAVQGANVAFLDINDEAGSALAAETGATYKNCDLRDIERVKTIIAELHDTMGAFGAVLNNAARDDRHNMFEIDADYWDECLNTNLRHQFFVTQQVAQPMADAGGGSIILFGSVSWMRGRPGIIAYTTSKAAINGMTRSLARELGPMGIRVNSLVPGAVHTERQIQWTPPEKNEEFLREQALKFRLNAHHIARMALFLASDESAGCAAANFTVDAGLGFN